MATESATSSVVRSCLSEGRAAAGCGPGSAPSVPLAPAERAEYAGCRTLIDVGRVASGWLAGRVEYLPTYCGSGPDPETFSNPDILPVLRGLNELGWLTDSSQPGRLATPDQDLLQRAYVSGVLPEALAGALVSASVGTDFVVLTVPPSAASAQVSVPVSVFDGVPSTWLGRTPGGGCHYGFFSALCPNAADAFQNAYGVAVFDPVWGRDDALWPWLRSLFDELASSRV